MKTLAIITLFGLACIGLRAADAPPQQSYSWRNAVIGGGGFVTGLITSPASRDLIYARTDVGGAYRWDESAKRWIPITDSFASEDFTGIESLAMDPCHSNRVYLAAGIYESTRSAIFRSEDQGSTWVKTEVPFKMGGNEMGRFNGERLAVCPYDSNLLFFGSRNDGLWESHDCGASWQPVPKFPVPIPARVTSGFWRKQRTPNPVGIVSVLFSHGILYAAISTESTNLFCSRDGGQHWEPVPGQPVGLRPNHVSPSSDGHLYLSYGNEPGPNRMTDGAVWKYDETSHAWTNVTPLPPASSPGGFGYGAVVVDPQNPRHLLASTFCRWEPHDEIFRSTNSGGTWTPLFSNATWNDKAFPYVKALKPHWIGSLAFSPLDSDRVWFTTGYGVWCCPNIRSADLGRPTSWNFWDAGLEETVPLTLASPPAGAHLLSGVGDIDGFLHEHLDQSPSQGSFSGPRFINTESIAFASRNPERMIRTGTLRMQGPHVAMSQDGGSHWHSLPGEPAPDIPGGTAAISADGRTLVLTKNGFSPEWSSDEGQTWHACLGLPAGIPVVADSVDPRRFYAFDPVAPSIFSSTNSARSFSSTAFKFPFPSSPAWRQWGKWSFPKLYASAANAGELWLADNTFGLWHGIDGGCHFQKIQSVESVFAFGAGRAAYRDNPPALFLFGVIDSHQGLFRSDDNGLSWIQINDADHQFGWITSLTGDPRVSGRVYLATSGRGIIIGDPCGNSLRFEHPSLISYSMAPVKKR